jgi:hypothetical protein
MTLSRSALLAAAALSLSFPAVAADPPPAQFVLTGGKIVTLDAKGTTAQALAIRDEKIV